MIDKNGAKRFMHYMSIGVSTFLIDISLLYLLVNTAHIPYLFATPLSFFIAVSINYYISRRFVFKKTETKNVSGYIQFLGIAGGGALTTTALMYALVTLLGVHYVAARVITASLVGIVNYLITLFKLFKVAGRH